MASRSVSLTVIEGIPLVRPGDDLAAILGAAIRGQGMAPADGDVVVVAQKIVSKAEGRYVDLATVTPSPRATELAAQTGKDARHVEVILSESDEVVRTREALIIVAHRLGLVMANAGVDQSNLDPGMPGDPVLLLPKDPDASAAALRDALRAALGVTMGVVISDSFGRPWRNGVVGVAIGAAGVPTLIDARGSPDLAGRPLRITEIGYADEVASAASLLMGEGDERIPAVLVRGLRQDAPAGRAADLVRPKHMDMFR